MTYYVCDSDCEYFICADTPSFGYEVDLTQKFVDRYHAYEAEKEFIQSKLHRYFTEARTNKQLLECQQGIRPKGF